MELLPENTCCQLVVVHSHERLDGGFCRQGYVHSKKRHRLDKLLQSRAVSVCIGTAQNLSLVQKHRGRARRCGFYKLTSCEFHKTCRLLRMSTAKQCGSACCKCAVPIEHPQKMFRIPNREQEQSFVIWATISLFFPSKSICRNTHFRIGIFTQNDGNSWLDDWFQFEHK